MQYNQQLEELVTHKQEEFANHHAKNYSEFIKLAATQSRARILHNLARKTKPPNPMQITNLYGQTTTADQANADAQRTKWKKVWNVTDSQMKRIHIPLDDVNNTSQPTQKEIKALRPIAKSFKHHPAMSYDSLKPHLIGELSDDALVEVIRLYQRAENEGKCPSQWRLAIMIMLPKPSTANGDP